MKTFAEYLPTMTTREREIVEAFHLAMEAWHDDDNPKADWPLEQMRSTPPAKEPVSVECAVGFIGDRVYYSGPLIPGIVSGDRVRVVKIEEAGK